MEFADFSFKIISLFKSELNCDLSDKQINQFFDYMNFLISENEKYNLTAIIEPEDIIYKHFLDSCEILKFGDIYLIGKSFIDIGCGAGFPSIPLAILYPNFSFTLVDSVNKKISFINELIHKISLNNIIAIRSRAEDIGHDKQYIEKYDYCLSRAVSRISVVLEYSSQLLKIGGKIFIYKLADIADELIESENAQKLLNISYYNNIVYSLLPNEPNRAIYTFVKTNKTSNKFPRKAGMPSKIPL